MKKFLKRTAIAMKKSLSIVLAFSMMCSISLLSCFTMYAAESQTSSAETIYVTTNGQSSEATDNWNLATSGATKIYCYDSNLAYLGESTLNTQGNNGVYSFNTIANTARFTIQNVDTSATTYPTASSGKKIVMFKNTSSWSSPKVYYWSDDNKSMSSWPGSSMTTLSGQYCYYAIPEDAEYVIFSNNGSSQTSDITYTDAINQYYDYQSGDWMSYGVLNEVTMNIADRKDSVGTSTSSTSNFFYLTGKTTGRWSKYPNPYNSTLVYDTVYVKVPDAWKTSIYVHYDVDDPFNNSVKLTATYSDGTNTYDNILKVQVPKGSKFTFSNSATTGSVSETAKLSFTTGSTENCYVVSSQKWMDISSAVLTGDIINKSSSVDIVGVDAKYYDYLSDAELYNTSWRNPIQAGTGLNGSKNAWFPFNQYNKDLSAYYQSSSDKYVAGQGSTWRYPLYFGNLCNTFKSYADSSGDIEGDKHDDTYSGSGWDSKRGWSIIYDNTIAYNPFGWYWVNNLTYNNQTSSYDRNMMYAANNSNGLITSWSVGSAEESEWNGTTYTVSHANQYASVQGLVQSTLSDGDLMVGTSTKAPWFNDTWLTDTKHNSNSIAQIISAKFPFRKSVNSDGTVTTYSFNSKDATDNVSFQWTGNEATAVQYGSGTTYGIKDGLQYFVNGQSSGYGIFPFNNSNSENLNYGFGIRIDVDFRVPDGGTIGGSTITSGNNGVNLSDGIYLNNGWGSYYIWAWNGSSSGRWLSTSFSDGDVITPDDVSGYDYFLLASKNDWDSSPSQTGNLTFDSTKSTGITLVSTGMTFKSGSFTSNGGSITTSGETVKFEYSGDDDLWVFVDDQLALDLGGSHKESTGRIIFTNNKVTSTADMVYTPGSSSTMTSSAGSVSSKTNTITGFDYNKTHKLTIFYMERGLIESNMKMSFTMTPVSNELEVQKSIDTSALNNGIKDDFVSEANDTFDFVTENATGSVSKTSELTDGSSVSYNSTFDNGEYITVKESKTTDLGYSYSTSYSVYDKTNSADKTSDTTTTAVNDDTYSGVTFKFGDANATKDISYLAKLINKPNTKNLSVSKAIYKANETDLADVGDKFDFVIELALDGTNYKPYNLEYSYSGDTSVTYTATDGKFKLGQGQQVIFKNLPENVKYRITEIAKDGFSIMSINGETSSSYSFEGVLNSSSSGTTDVTYANKQSTTETELQLKKTLDGESYTGSEFTFRLTGLDEMTTSHKDDSDQYIKSISRESYSTTSSTVSNGVVSFKPQSDNTILNFTTAGYYRFMITEEQKSSADYSCSSDIFLVEIEVTANGAELTATPTYYAIPSGTTISGDTDEAKYGTYFSDTYKTISPTFANTTTRGKVTVNKTDQSGADVADTKFALIRVAEADSIDKTELQAIINANENIITSTTDKDGVATFEKLIIFKTGGEFDASGKWTTTDVDNYITGKATYQTYCLFEYSPATGYNPTYQMHYFTLPVEGKYEVTYEYQDGAIVMPHASGEGTNNFLFIGLGIIGTGAVLFASYTAYDRVQRRKRKARHTATRH